MPHLTRNAAYELGQRWLGPLTYSDVLRWLGQYTSGWYNLGGGVPEADGKTLRRYVPDLYRILIEARDAELLTEMASSDWPNVYALIETAMTLDAASREWTLEVLDRWILPNASTVPSDQLEQAEAVTEEALTRLAGITLDERALRRYIRNRERRLYPLERDDPNRRVPHRNKAAVERLIAAGQTLTYDELAAAIDATPEGHTQSFARADVDGKLLRIQPLFLRLVEHHDWARLAKVWTRNENRIPTENAGLVHEFMSAVPDDVFPTEAIDFLLRGVVENPYIGPYLDHKALGEIDEWLKSWGAPLERWARSEPYARIGDFLAAEEYTRQVVRHSPEMRRVLVRHIRDNQRLPAMVDLFRDAPATTRTHFYYRGLDSRSGGVFDPNVAAPISVTWDLETARWFAKEYAGSEGLIMVIRVPAGVHTLAIIHDATYHDERTGNERRLEADEAFINDQEMVLPSFASLTRVTDPGEQGRFIAQWYNYRFKRDVFYERTFERRLVLVNFAMAERGLGLAKRLRERSPGTEYLKTYEPTDNMTDAAYRRRL